MKLSLVKPFLFALLALLMSACNLGTAQDAREIQMFATQTAAPEVNFATDADITLIDATPGEIILTPLGSPAVVGVPVGVPIGGVCNSLRVDVGDDPGNTLRLRQQPTNSAEIILLIPNSTVVLRVTGSTETTADGYTWVNVQYTDPNGIIATGWAAKNAMRDRMTLKSAC